MELAVESILRTEKGNGSNAIKTLFINFFLERKVESACFECLNNLI